MVKEAERVLNSPHAYRPLGQSGMALIHEQYSLDVCLPRMLSLYESAMDRSG
jgi:hypothetical protein